MIKIIEVIRKSRLKPEELWFIDYIKDLEEVKSDKYPDSIFYKKDSELVFRHDLKYMYLYCHREKIWSVLEIEHGLEYAEIRTLIKKFVNECLNWVGFRPIPISTNYIRFVEDELNQIKQ